MELQDLYPTLDNYIRYHAFDKARRYQDSAVEYMLENAPDDADLGGLELRQMCAKVPAHLADSVTEVCQGLGMKKRQFIELAVREAVANAEQALKLVRIEEEDYEANRPAISYEAHLKAVKDMEGRK